MRVHDDEMRGIDAWARLSRRTTISPPKASYIMCTSYKGMGGMHVPLSLYGITRSTGYRATSSRDLTIHPPDGGALGQDSVGSQVWDVCTFGSQPRAAAISTVTGRARQKAGIAHGHHYGTWPDGHAVPSIHPCPSRSGGRPPRQLLEIGRRESMSDSGWAGWAGGLTGERDEICPYRRVTTWF